MLKSLCFFFLFDWYFISFYLFIGFLVLLGDTNVYNRFFFFLDNLRLVIIWLRIWVFLLSRMQIVKFNLYKVNFNILISLNIFLLFKLFLVFCLKSLIWFYFTFERRFLPVFYIIIGWGRIIDRIVSGLYLFFYTVLGSLPLFFSLILNYRWGYTDFFLLELNYEYNFILFFFFILVFLVKFPIYGLHLWLLKAHVEAPVWSSIILSGVLLKLGGFGLVRFFFLWEGIRLRKDFLFFFSLWGGLFISYICLVSRDIKLRIACSSVVHIRFCISCLIIINRFRVKGGLILIVGHGLCSSCIFFLCNIFYIMFNRRSLIIRKGILNISPLFRIIWFLICRANISCPPTINLLGELVIVRRLLRWRRRVLFLLMILIFLSACYRLYLFYIYRYNFYIKNINYLENNIMFLLVRLLHWLPLNFFILFIFIYY